MNSTEEPDYEKCVTIVTKATLREMFRPACLCLGSPVCLPCSLNCLPCSRGR